MSIYYIRTSIMSIIQIYSILNRIWLVLIFLQLVIIILSSKADGVEHHFIREFITKESTDVVASHQPALTIMFYNSTLLLLYLITRAKFIISIGIPLGGVFLYLSFAGDLSFFIFGNNGSDYWFINSTEFQNLIRISLLSVIINVIASNSIVQELNSCSDLQALIEIFLLIFLIYLFLYYLGISIYLILGHIAWDSKGALEKKECLLRKEINALKTNLAEFVTKIDQKTAVMTSLMRCVIFIPTAILLLYVIILNYFKQISRNTQLLLLLMFKAWITRRKSSLQKEQFLLFRAKVSHLSIIFVLCTVYIWLNINIGAESVLTKIVYGFSTIILIPIAINKFSSINNR